MEPERLLTRPVEATRIPEGEPYTLPAQTAVTLTHQLGGNFTVISQYGMFRILGKDADCLGLAAPSAAPAAQDPEGPLEEAHVWEKLKGVYDPEIPVNIVDLGLVYSLQLQPLESGRYAVAVAMTLTAPGCGMGPVIAEDARQKVLELSGVESVEVALVWDPPWSQEMISQEGRMELGLV